MDNKKKKFNTNRVAAYALSGVMLASVIPYNVFANAEVFNDNIQSESVLEKSQENPNIALRDAAPPEDTSTSSDAKNAVHGYVGVLVGGDINADLAAETGQRFKPIGGVKVYFQWYEKTGNRTSPTYYATSGADGQFHIKVKPYIGRDGKLVKFDADTSVSGGYESYKMWVDESTIPDGYQLQYSTGEGVEFKDRRVAGGGYQLGPNRLVNYRVLLMEKQDEAKMHKEATPTTPQISKTGQGALWGKVSWDYESTGGVQWGIVSTPTSGAEGVTVTASYLSDHALKQIYSKDTANMLGLSRPSDIRGSGWTFKLETQLQEWIAEQVAKDKDKWIAETVSAKTNAEGDYLIQFKGTWGPHRNTHKVAEYERVAGKYYVGDAHRWTKEEVDRLGTVAENAEDGGFLTGALDWNEKHVNSDWLFISTKDTDDVVKRTPWNYNWYTGSNNAWGIHGGWAQAAFGVSTVQAANSTRADFNLAPAEIKFNITNFDTQANTATPGDVAVTKTAGLPYKNTNDSFKIVWYDQDGNKVDEEPTQKPTSTGELAEGTYDTKDVKETSTFIAKLHYVKPGGGLGQVLAQDAFTVKISKLVVSAYDEVSIKNPAANDDSMKGATYSAEGLPEGLTIDEKTGTISGKAKVPGKYNVTITTSILDEESGETMEGTSNYTALVTDSPLEHGEVGVEYNKTVKPAEVEGYVFKNVTSKFIGGKEVAGLAIENNQITGTPTEEVAATQEDPNVEITYDIYKLNSKGEPVLIKEGHKDLVPLEITKAESQAPKYEPAYADVEGTPGTKVTTEAPKFLDQKSEADPKPEADPQPKDVKFALGDGAPQDATIDENTGVVTYTPTARDANTTVDIPVKVTYSDGTIDETLAKIKVGQAQAESYQPEYTEAEGKAGTETEITAPNFTDKDGKSAIKPDGTKFALGKDAPQGATIDEDTGKITFTPSIDDAGTIVNIPVIVTYKDGSTDEVKAPVKVAEADNLNYEPDYKSVVAQVDHPVTVEAPKFLDKDNKEVNPQPTGMTFAIAEGFTTNGTLTIDDKTGAITYTAVDADKDTVIEVPVIVTYADGSKESVKAKIDVPSDANFYDPKGKQLTTEQGTVPAAKDGVEFKFTPPADTKYEWQAVPKVNEAGETTGIVKVSYPDGTEDLVEVPVTVTQSESKVTKVDDTNKKPVDPTGQKQGTGIIVTNPDDDTTVTATDANGKDVTPVINKETGEIEVTPGTDATGPITVTVTDNDLPEGKKVIEVPVAEKSAKPEVTAPTAGDQTISGTGVAGAKITLVIEGGVGSEDILIAKDVVVGQDRKWTADVPSGVLLEEKDKILATQVEEGKSVSDPGFVRVTAADTTPPRINRISDQTVVEGKAIKDIIVKTDDPKAKITVESLPKGVTYDEATGKISGTPTVENWGKTEEVKEFYVTVNAIDEAGNESEETFTITVQRDTDGDGTPDIYDKDDDGDGISDEDEKKAGTDPKDKNSKPDEKDTTAPKIDRIVNQTVVEKQPIKEVEVKTDDPEAEITVDGLPNGVTFDKDSKKISGKPEIKDWNDTDKENPEEVRDVTVTVKAKDKAGNESEETFTITVQRDTDGDGTPDIYDKDDDGDGISDEDEKKAGTDPKDKNSKPAAKTDVTGTPSTVNPTDDVQDTGLTVTNKYDTTPTTVTAKDEDGTEVKVTVDPTTGKISVKPGKTVDGPITVTVKDDDFKTEENPEGTKTFEVPVKGHEKDRDDNSSGTSVIDKDKKSVKPNGEEQGTGIKVVNKDDGTKVTAKDKNSNDVPATIDPNTGEVKVTPGEGTEGPIIVTVEDPDLPDGKTEVKVEVAKEQLLIFDAKGGEPANQKNKAYVGDTITGINAPTKEGFKFVKWVKLGTDKELDLSQPLGEDMLDENSDSILFVAVWEKTEKDATDAEKNPAVAPDKTEVKDKKKLTDDEKKSVEDKVKEKNPKANKVEVGNDGSVTLTYPDGTTNTLTPEQTVTEKTTGQTDADKNPAVAPDKTEVEDKNNLTPEEKTEVENKVKEKNPKANKVEVGNDGSVTLTYPDGTTNTLTPEQTVTEKTTGQTDADKNPAVAPDKTEVEDKTKLTPEEKTEVENKVKEKNPKANKVEVGNDGSVTLTYPDGTTNTLTPEQTVTEKTTGQTDADKNPAVAPDKTEVEDKNNLTPEEKDKVKEEVKKANPKASDVTVDDKGNAELTYPDGSKNTIPADKTVTEKDTGSTGGNDGYRPGHGGSDVFDGLFRRHDYTPTYPVKTVVPEKTEYGTPVRDTLWYVFHINEFEYEVVRNGVVTKRKMDVTPVLQNDRTMLPLRYVAEALQADVTWDAKTRTATFTKDGLTASIQIDSDEIVLSNGKTVKMDSKPLNINDRILVSVTNVANVFGLTNGNTLDKIDQDIEWEQEDKSATIYIRR